MIRLLVPLLAVVIASCGQKPRTVTIAAAASLKELLESTKAEFEKSRPGCCVVFSFEASSTLSRQIEEGAPYAAFLSADAASVDRLGAKIDGPTRRVFLSNRLALLGPEGKPAQLEDVPGDAKVAVAGEEVPAGKAWRGYLARTGRLAALESRLVVAANVRAALALFDSEATDYALVYATDAAQAKRAHATWIVADTPPTSYVAGAVAGATEEARAYVSWLGSPEFRARAKELGFIVP